MQSIFLPAEVILNFSGVGIPLQCPSAPAAPADAGGGAPTAAAADAAGSFSYVDEQRRHASVERGLRELATRQETVYGAVEPYAEKDSLKLIAGLDPHTLV